jgi:putative nucleotidyltransferase with HDIG domain
MDTSKPGEIRSWDRLAAHIPLSAPWRTRIGTILFAVLLTVSVSAALLVRLVPDDVDLRVGEPAPRQVLAPTSITYVSHYLSEQQREQAAAQVLPVYKPIDTEIVRKQLELARGITDYLDAVRSDPYATPQSRRESIESIDGLRLSPSAINAILNLDNDSWDAVRADVNAVLDQVMRSEIREDELEDARRRVPALLSHTLSMTGREAAEALIQALLVPNSLYDAEATEARREEARERVLPVSHSIKQGEAVLREGELVTPLHLEELEALGLRRATDGWGRSVGTVLFVALMVVALVVYILRLHPQLWLRPRRIVLLALSLVAAALMARLMVPEHTLLPYLFPAAALAMLASVLIDVQVGVFLSGLLGLLVGFVSGGSLELVAYTLLGSVVGCLALSHMVQLNSFAQAGALVALANLLTVGAFRLYRQDFDTTGLLQLFGVTVASGALSASLTLAAYAFVGRVFGITTTLQLLDLARPTHPLFRQLLLKAPGTYHHSIIVGNMAERAAQLIGADPLLARVGAYYHDIGKTVRPYFFIENQAEGANPHDRLDPRTSAQIIIGHVSDGVKLARQYGLPERVQDIIAQHHGTTMASFFYRMACKEAKEEGAAAVNEADFCYPGPRPDTKEAAIVMLADVEAVVRSLRPETPAEMEDVVRQFVQEKLISGQLARSNLTLRDLDQICEAFSDALKSIFHPRIQYPEKEGE